MLLIHSKSDSAFKANVKTLVGEIGKSPHVKDQRQALAIAYATKRRGRADGGSVDDAGAAPAPPPSNFAAASSDLGLTPQEQNIYQHHLNNLNGAGKVTNSDGSVSTVYQAVVQGPDEKYYNIPTVWDGKILPVPDAVQRATQNGWNQWPSYSSADEADARYEKMHDYMGEDTARYLGIGRARGGQAGIAGFALGGPQAPWQVKAEARGMMHTGPINSVVPGRTDNHKMSVPGGAYVVNADTVSHIGQNNTNAGQAILSHMFGQSGPYGMGHNMGIKHGAGAPRPPAMGKIPADTGGSRGSNSVGQPVPVMTAGGEFVIHPDIVARVGGGDLKRGHAVLDKWMTDMRKEHIRTLKKLPGPAKG